MKVTAKVARSGEWWAIEVPEVPGVFTQVKRLDQASQAAAEAVADFAEVDAEDVEVVVLDVVLKRHLRVALDDASEAGRAAVAAQSKASAAMRETARLLRFEAGFTTRDAAVLLGISHQRVAQLTEGVSAEDGPRETQAPPTAAAAKAPTPITRKATTKESTRSSKSGRFVTKQVAARYPSAAAPAARKPSSKS